jgi:hypothetical protein
VKVANLVKYIIKAGKMAIRLRFSLFPKYDVFQNFHASINHMDIIPFLANGTAKHLSLLVSRRLKSSTLTFLSLRCRDPGTLKITNIPVAIFDQWAQSHQDSPLRAQFKGSTLFLSMPSTLHDGAASSIGSFIRDTVVAMCPARDARVRIHGGCTSPAEF